MKETTIVSKRLTLTKEERPIAKSWGRWWNYMGGLERKEKRGRLLFGDWSGYKSSQYQITHVDYCPKDLPDDYRGIVDFTDGTSMSVWVESVTRAEIIRRRLRCRPNYNELIGKLIKGGTGYWSVKYNSPERDRRPEIVFNQ